MLSRSYARIAGSLILVLGFTGSSSAISVELSEIRGVVESAPEPESSDESCLLPGECIAALTRDGSLELTSAFVCEEKATEEDDDNFSSYGGERRTFGACGVTYTLTEAFDISVTISSVMIALHPDSVTELALFVDGQVQFEWSATPGTTDLQEIPGLAGVEAASFVVQGIQDFGETLGIVEVQIFIEVDQVEALGVSAGTRNTISATSTTDAASAMNTVDGDVSDGSAWTCASGETCEITYDFGVVESLEQLRMAFSDAADGGELIISAAGEAGVFAVTKTITVDGGRPTEDDGLTTYGGVRALARYVKMEVAPASGGVFTINEVEFRVGEDTPLRPTAEKSWLKATGMLPMGSDVSSSLDPNFDARLVSEGGCDSPAHFDGCHIYYIKDGDMSDESRWTCGPTSTGQTMTSSGSCDAEFNINIYRFVRQIQLAFYLGDEQHDEFSIEAYTRDIGWAVVVPSAITSGDTTGYQTFDLKVHTSAIRLVPKFQQVVQFINIKEMVVLEKAKTSFLEGTVPVYGADANANARDIVVPFSKNFKFEIAEVGDSSEMDIPHSTVTGLRMKFAKERTFVFDVFFANFNYDTREWEQVTERFTSAGGAVRTWEIFTFSEPIATYNIAIIAVEGPTFSDGRDYPAFRVGNMQIYGEIIETPGTLKMVTTTMAKWGRIPDIIGDGVSEQDEIMTAICEAKGSTYDGTDCAGELDDSKLRLDLRDGDFFLDGPVFIKSGVTLAGTVTDDAPGWTFFIVYDGPKTTAAGEDAVVVIDGAIDAEVENIYFQSKMDRTGPIVPGTVGNLCLEVRNSEDLRFSEMLFSTARAGAATFTDSRNISTFIFWSGEYETGNFLELTRVDDFNIDAFPEMAGLLIDTCNNVVLEGVIDGFEIPDPGFEAPTAGSEQTANVVITGNSSNILFKDFLVGVGAEPRFLMESTEPLTLDNAVEYTEAASGDCIIQVPQGTTDDLIVQQNTENLLTKSGDCWVLV